MFEGKRIDRIYDGKRTARLGTDKNPAAVMVRTKKRMKEIQSVFEKNDWKYTIELQPGKPEDTTDLEMLLHPVETRIAEKAPGRNDPCPCGSGKKFKKCCGS